MVVRYLALEPTLMIGQNNLVDFLNMLAKSAQSDILDFRLRQKSGDESYAGLGPRMLPEDLHRGHSF
jgi:hypothetical protein